MYTYIYASWKCSHRNLKGILTKSSIGVSYIGDSTCAKGVGQDACMELKRNLLTQQFGAVVAQSYNYSCQKGQNQCAARAIDHRGVFLLGRFWSP